MHNSESSTLENAHTFLLNNNVQMPVMGIGTGIVSLGGIKSIYSDVIKRNGENIKNAYRLEKVIKKSLDLGCQMFDTSKAYGKSEYILGKSIRNIRRENVFIITKLTNTDQRSGNVRKALESSLRALGTEYIDLYLIHWPQTGTFINSWLQMEQLYNEGLIRAIGVSNFHKHHLDELLSVSSIIPAVNEFEIHPLLNQKELVRYCFELGIQPIAYTPIARMHEKVRYNQKLIDLSYKYQKSIAQIILRWHFQQGIITIPHTFKESRLDDYINIYDFKMTTNDLQVIDSINENYRLRYDPDNCDFSRL